MLGYAVSRLFFGTALWCSNIGIGVTAQSKAAYRRSWSQGFMEKSCFCCAPEQSGCVGETQTSGGSSCECQPVLHQAGTGRERPAHGWVLVAVLAH